MELQVKTIETSQRVNLARAQIQTLKHSIKHSELTDKEIAHLPDGTNAYQSVGRMYASARP